jgi:hypothetical protein
MSDLKERFKNKCLLKLQDLPKNWSSGGQKLHYCPLAVTRLKAVRAARADGRSLTQEEEANLPGCPWAVKAQMSGYCWFIFEATQMADAPMSESDIAAILDLPVDQVKSASNSSLTKIQEDPQIVEIKSSMGSEAVVKDRLSIEDEYIHHD